MKRIVGFFILSVLGIVLTEILGGMLFAKVSQSLQLTVAVCAVLIKVLFYAISVSTLIALHKVKGNRWVAFFKVLNWIFTIVMGLVFAVYSIAIINTLVTGHKYFNKNELEQIPSTAVKAKVNSLVDYNGLSKDFILSLRSGNIDANFTKNIDYKPNPDVWGQMQDKGLWFSLERSVCFNKNTDCKRKLKGVSAMSRLINNPMILVAPVMIATYHLDEKLSVCSDEGLKLVPKNIYFDSVNSKIIVVYKGTKALTKCKYLQLSGLNARDFGFNWGKVIDAQNILFPFPGNISKGVYEFRDVVVPGAYCEKDDMKCNVLSPVDDKVVFNVTSYPANIELKLWHKKPFLSIQEADFNMEIRFIEN